MHLTHNLFSDTCVPLTVPSFTMDTNVPVVITVRSYSTDFIQYIGDWEPSAVYNSLKQTIPLQKAMEDGASVTLAFHGMSVIDTLSAFELRLMTASQGVGIELWAYQVDSLGVPKIQCNIDNHPTNSTEPVPKASSTEAGSNETPLEWRVIFNSSLTNGEHDISCNVSNASSDQPFYLLGFNIHPSNDTELLKGDITTVSLTPSPVKTQTTVISIGLQTTITETTSLKPDRITFTRSQTFTTTETVVSSFTSQTTTTTTEMTTDSSSPQTTTTTASGATTNSNNPQNFVSTAPEKGPVYAGIIVGAVLGGLSLVIVLMLAFFRSRSSRTNAAGGRATPDKRSFRPLFLRSSRNHHMWQESAENTEDGMFILTTYSSIYWPY